MNKESLTLDTGNLLEKEAILQSIQHEKYMSIQLTKKSTTLQWVNKLLFPQKFVYYKTSGLINGPSVFPLFVLATNLILLSAENWSFPPLAFVTLFLIKGGYPEFDS